MYNHRILFSKNVAATVCPQNHNYAIAKLAIQLFEVIALVFFPVTKRANNIVSRVYVIVITVWGNTVKLRVYHNKAIMHQQQLIQHSWREKALQRQLTYLATKYHHCGR